MEKGNLMTSNEKLARMVTDIEGPAKHFEVNGKSSQELFEMEARNKFNQKVDDLTAKLQDNENEVKKFADKLNDVLPDLELKAINNNLLIRPFKENPFQRIKKSASGIIYDLEGYKPIYKSHEDGEEYEEESAIKVAEVIDAAPECKYVKEGDTIFYTTVSSVPVPFFRSSFEMICENRVIAVVGTKLTERFNNNKK